MMAHGWLAFAAPHSLPTDESGMELNAALCAKHNPSMMSVSNRLRFCRLHPLLRRPQCFAVRQLSLSSYPKSYKMQTSRLLLRSVRRTNLAASNSTSRLLSTSFPRCADSNPDRRHDGSDAHAEAQKSKPLNPHLTNTTSTMKNDVPSVGADKAPPELISSVDPEYTPKDDAPENTEKMTGGTQPGDPKNVSKADLGVGEMEGAKFKVEPLRRTGEDSITMRARLLCPFLIQTVP